MPLSKRSRTNRRAHNYDLFEPRRMLAGDVTAFEWGGHLYIRGDAESNQIQMAPNDNGQLEITGVDGTTINNGTDSFVVDGTSGFSDSSGSTTQFHGGLRVHMGPGHDSIKLDGAKFEDLSVVYGGTGDDSIEFSETTFMDRLTLQTYTGDDSITVTDSEFHDDFYVMPHDGADTVMMENDMTMGDSIVFTGEGDDHVMVGANDLLGGTQMVLTGNGNDVIEIHSPHVGENGFGVYAGHGTDHVTAEFENALIEGNIIVNGQQGNDIGVTSMNPDQLDQVFEIGFEANGDLVFDGGVEGGAAGVLAGIDSLWRDSVSNQRYASRVVLDTAQDIKSLEWTGTYARDAFFIPDPTVVDRGDSFIIEIFEGAGDGAPDSSSAVRFEVGGANRVDSGETAEIRIDTESTFEYPIYEYSAEIDFTMEAGKEYWVSIYTAIDEVELAQHNFWGWGYAVGRVEEAVMTQGFDPSDGTTDKNWRYISDDGPKPDLQVGLNLDFRMKS